MQVHQRTAQTGKYYAPDVEPSVDSSLPILSVEGLSTRDLPHPMLVHATTVHSDTTGSGQSRQFLGSDMRAAYAPGVTLDGQGQTVGLVELGPKSLTLPNNRAVVVLAATLSLQTFGAETNLAGVFNATGIYTDGSSFSADGGLDAGGAAYSANLL